MMKRSIAIKIFSIALLLLLLMVVVAAISIHSTRGMRNEMGEIADCYTPLTFITEELISPQELTS